MHRTEKDSIGALNIPADALYGIHSLRAAANFPVNTPFPEAWYRAMGTVKYSCYEVYRRFRDAASGQYGDHPGVKTISDEKLNALINAAKRISQGEMSDSFIVPALQGGAGTSINMNINEIIANAALLSLNLKPGDYHHIDPIEECNIYQSTNDVVPTALTIATMNLLNTLAEEINALRGRLEQLERDNRTRLRPGYTQMQEAVPSSFGLLFGTYNESLSRDWWRVSKSLERIRTVNMGGGATGTGLAVPRFFIMEIVPELRRQTGLPISRSENMCDATSSLDRWVEVHATIKSHAVNLEKMVSDLRLLASGLLSPPQIAIPEKQVGSSIMPGKINPVIPEFIISAAHKIYGNDQIITSLCAMGTLELNAYIPLIGACMIESLELLIACNRSALTNMIDGLTINYDAAYERVIRSSAITTALIPFTGYNKAAEAAALMKEKGVSIFKANEMLRLIDDERLKEILEPANLLKLGYSLGDGK